MGHKSNYRPSKINKATIRTGGKPTPGVRFQGELMTCIMCGKQQQSDPRHESGWTYIESEPGRGAYVCPEELRAAREGRQSYAEAYEPILLKILGLRPR